MLSQVMVVLVSDDDLLFPSEEILSGRRSPTQHRGGDSQYSQTNDVLLFRPRMFSERIPENKPPRPNPAPSAFVFLLCPRVSSSPLALPLGLRSVFVVGILVVVNQKPAAFPLIC